MSTLLRRPVAPVRHVSRPATETRRYFVLGVMVVALERFVIPTEGGSVALMPLVVVALLVWDLIMTRLRLAADRVLIYLSFVIVGCIATGLSTGQNLLSLAQVALLVLPASLCLGQAFWPQAGWGQSANLGNAGRSFLLGIVSVTVCASGVAVVQSAFSAAGVGYFDPVGLLPSRFLVEGFNTAYPVVWGGGWLKANGGFFLEPSVLSLYCGLSLVALLAFWDGYTRRRAWVCTILLLAGMATSVAVSGLIVLPILIWQVGRRRFGVGRVVVVSLVLLALIGSVPVVRQFAEKAAVDPTLASTSAGLRLYVPYAELLPHAWAHPVVGAGSGYARQIVESQLVVSTTPTLVKLLIDFGVLGAALFAALVLSLCVAARLPGVIKVALVVALVVPTDALAPGPIAISVLLAFALSDPGAQRPVRRGAGPPLPRSVGAGGYDPGRSVLREEKK